MKKTTKNRIKRELKGALRVLSTVLIVSAILWTFVTFFGGIVYSIDSWSLENCDKPLTRLNYVFPIKLLGCWLATVPQEDEGEVYEVSATGETRKEAHNSMVKKVSYDFFRLECDNPAVYGEKVSINCDSERGAYPLWTCKAKVVGPDAVCEDKEESRQRGG